MLVVALGVTCLMSANTTDSTVESNGKEIPNEKNEKMVQEKGDCFPFTLSCGIQGTACGDNTAELISLIWDVDDTICGK